MKNWIAIGCCALLMVCAGCGKPKPKHAFDDATEKEIADFKAAVEASIQDAGSEDDG